MPFIGRGSVCSALLLLVRAGRATFDGEICRRRYAARRAHEPPAAPIKSFTSGPPVGPRRAPLIPNNRAMLPPKTSSRWSERLQAARPTPS